MCQIQSAAALGTLLRSICSSSGPSDALSVVIHDAAKSPVGYIHEPQSNGITERAYQAQTAHSHYAPQFSMGGMESAILNFAGQQFGSRGTSGRNESQKAEPHSIESFIVPEPLGCH